MRIKTNSNPKWRVCSVVIALALSAGMLQAQSPAKGSAPAKPSTPVVKPAEFKSAEEAADTLIAAVDKYDVPTLEKIFGSAGRDIVFTGEPPQDRELAAAFIAQAREKKTVSFDPNNKNRAYLLIGKQDWPFALPIVKRGTTWSFDPIAGRQELLYRRIGGNELDAIDICEGFVVAQHEYALEKHDGSLVNQYAQRIISTPGKHDGLAWQNDDGTWAGPVGENAARAIEKGYAQGDPYHGYYFKVLKGQGKSAPLGEMDFVVKGAMIGGFALIAFPAEYSITGVKTFMVSHDGVVYEKDLGPTTLDAAKKIELFEPDSTWTPVSP